MLTKKSVAVLEVGSEMVTCVIAQRGVNGTFIFKSVSEKVYDGFDSGKFFSKKSFSNAIISVIEETSKNARMRISDLYVSVPGEFAAVRTCNQTLAFDRKRKISDKELRELYEGFKVSDSSDYFITDVSAVFFELDDGRRVLHPKGCKTYKLTAVLSYYLCQKEYGRFVKSICKSAGVKNVHFVSESLAECEYLLSEEQRECPRLLIDCGYLTTNVCVAYGGGVLYQQAIPYGGGYVAVSLIDAFDLDLDFAEKLKRMINLGLDGKSNEKYQVVINDDFETVSVEKANLTVCKSIDEMWKQLSSLLSGWGFECDKNIPVALTGGGICYMRGAKELIASRMGTGVFVLVPPVPSMNAPEKAACLAVIDRAIRKVNGGLL